MTQNFVAQFIQLLKHWLCDMWSGVAVEKKWSLSVDQRWLQELQSSVRPINLLSVLLRGNGLAGTQKAVVGQTPSSSAQDLSLAQVCLWEVLYRCLVQSLSWLSPAVI